MVRVARASEYPNPEELIPSLLPWIHASGNPYFDWFFGGAERASAVLEAWISRGSSEVSVRRVSLLYFRDRIAGGFIAMGGNDLKRCRKADTIALMRGFDPEERSMLTRRMSAASNLFKSAADDEYYLSKMGLTREFRGQGLGRRLVEEYIGEGKSRGFRRFRLDVYADNTAAVGLYENYGFTVDGRAECKEAGMSYCSMVYETTGE
jgi:ribosomal protein S18 acetylase RimI-like enzyme